MIDENFLRELKEKNYVLAYERFSDIKKHQEKGINIPEIVFNLLKELGFNPEDLGTIFLEDVITNLYHERKLFVQNDKYYDFNDYRNNHYVYTKDEYDYRLATIRKEIEKVIASSYLQGQTPNEIIYSVVNDVISQCARDTKKLELKISEEI